MAYVTRQWHVRLCRLFTAGCAESVRGAPGHLGFGVSALALGFRSSRVPSRPTIRSSRRRVLASLKLVVMRAILVLHCCGRRGLTLALGAEKHSFVLLLARRHCRFRLQWSSVSLWSRCWLRWVCCARSGLACVTGQWRVRVCGLLTSGCAERVWGAPGVFGFGFRQRRRGFVVLGFPCA